MKLYAISDLHLGHQQNREALLELPAHPRDWLILAGDIGETEEHLALAFSAATRRFARVLWVPGNHELWTTGGPRPGAELRGEAKYQRLVELCRRFGVVSPEDPYPLWMGDGGPCVIAPLFLLYDYSFRPDDVPLEGALAWAEESGVVCTDEFVLHPEPHPSRAAWCDARIAYTEARLAEIGQAPVVIVNHFPLREELVRLEWVPRFSLWCGTRRTHDWHARYRAKVVVYGHLHMRGTEWIDGVRFEEVSLGYPADWEREEGMAAYLREILPGPPPPA